jgi:hypothetical protein
MASRRRLAPWVAAAVAIGPGVGCTPGPIDVATLSSGGLTNGLVAHWTFDEDAGVLANDSSGNGHTATVFGPGWSWIPGKFGSALHFSGLDQASVPGLPQATESYSVSAWLFLASDELTPPTPPIANLLNTELPGGGWALYTTLTTGYAGYDFRYWTGVPAGSYEMSPSSACNCLTFDSWMHLAAVVDATTSSLTFYLDGSPLQVVPAPGGISPGASMLYMARAQVSGYTLTGALDDVAIYNRALVPEEVVQLSQAPAPDPQ